MSPGKRVAVLLSDPQTGTAVDITHRFWKLIISVSVTVTLLVVWTSMRPRTEFRSTALIEVEAIDETGEQRTISAASLLVDLRSDAIHEEVRAATGLSTDRVEWRVSQDEDTESLRLDVGTGDPVLSLAYVEHWLIVADSMITATDNPADLLAAVDDRLQGLTEEREGLEGELSTLDEQYRSSRDVEVGAERDLRRMEVSGESDALQAGINEHIDLRERLERAGPADELTMVVLEEPKQASWKRGTGGLVQDAAFGSFLGLLLGFGAALLAAVVRPRLYSRSDLESLGVEVIGPIPTELLGTSGAVEIDGLASTSQVLVGSCGEDDDLSARVAAQLATGGAYELKSRELGVKSVGSLQEPSVIDEAGLALGTVVAVRSGESTSRDLHRVHRSIRHAGGHLVCVVLVDPRRRAWFGLSQAARHAG